MHDRLMSESRGGDGVDGRRYSESLNERRRRFKNSAVQRGNPTEDRCCSFLGFSKDENEGVVN